MAKNKAYKRINSSENVIELMDDYSTFENLIESGLIKNELPYIWLTVQFEKIGSQNSIEQLTKVISEKLQLSFKQGIIANTYHFSSKKTELDHKYHCIDLWAAAAMIQHSEQKSKFLLCSRSRLADVIKSTPMDEIYEENCDTYREWEKESYGFTSTEDILLYLSHAGIHLKSSKLTSLEFKQLVSSLLTNSSLKRKETQSLNPTQTTKAS